MAGLPRSIIKKYGVSKRAWEVYRGGGARSPRRSRSYSGGRMAKRKYGRRRRGGSGGVMSLVKPLAFGTLAGLVTPRIPFLNTMPLGNAALGAAAGYFGKRNLAGALVGAAGGAIIAPPVGNALNQMTGMRLY